MMSVSDMFYNDQEPVAVYGQTSERGRPARRGYLSRQDSRNFRSSASPPPSRSSHHASSWFGHRKSSQSPPRSRHYAYETEYSDYRRSRHGRSPDRLGQSSWFGTRRNSLSPPSSYHDIQSHTKYKEDYTGYPQETGYTAENGYAPGAGYSPRYGHSYSGQSGHLGHSGHGYATGAPYVAGGTAYVATDGYRGEHVPVVSRTYQAPYGSATLYNKNLAETIKLKVPLCCEACEERITNHMLALEGVESVTCDQLKQKVTVRGVASPSEVLRQGRECFKQTKFW